MQLSAIDLRLLPVNGPEVVMHAKQTGVPGRPDVAEIPSYAADGRQGTCSMQPTPVLILGQLAGRSKFEINLQ
jgi:hypothetical protein